MKLYQKFAQVAQALHNCQRRGPKEWAERHRSTLSVLVDQLPHGSGIDGHTKIVHSFCTDTRLAFVSEFHRLDDNGMYRDWVEFTVVVQASLSSEIIVDVSLSEEDESLQEYLTDVFYTAFTSELTELQSTISKEDG